jgi:hypothetical protein
MPKVEGYVSAKRYTPAPGKMKTEVLVGLRDRDGEIRLAFTGRNAPKRWRSPSPEAIRKARKTAGLTQREAAEKCYSALRSWQDWEYGQRRMHPAVWQVFLGATRATAATLERKRSAPPARGSARRARPQRESAA